MDEVTTLCCHIEANHAVGFFITISVPVFKIYQGKYCLWAKSAYFESKLPGDVKKHKVAAASTITRTLDGDLREKKGTAHVIPYSNRLFRQVAVEWLVTTDQVSIMYAIFSFYLSIIAYICI